MRIVSLIASSTEIICALGGESQLVGRSHECDYPKTIQSLPVTTETKFAADGTSYQIDERVKAILQEGLSVYRVKADLLKSLKPDLIVTQTQCEVCAVSLKDVEEATRVWLDFRPKIVSLHPNCLEDLWTDINQVAQALGVPERGNQLITHLKARLHHLEDRAQEARKTVKTPPRVACIEWIDPLMAAGNWVPEQVQLAGGVSIFGKAGQHSPWMTWDDLKKEDPDLIIIMPCGFDISRTQMEMPHLMRHPIWKSLKAVQKQKVFLVDGNQYFNRPGPRLVDSAEILFEIFYPEFAPPRYQGTGWIRADSPKT